jgi:biopolymer transport protein ExbD
MNLRPRRAEEPEVNLVSLIDVVLMLVVFFMLSSTFVDETSLRLRLPEVATRAGPPPAAEPIVITVTETGGYRLNGRDLINASGDTLRTALLKVAGEDRNATITLRADARATHQAVVTALDVAGRLGFKEIDIATVPASAAAAPAAP